MPMGGKMRYCMDAPQKALAGRSKESTPPLIELPQVRNGDVVSHVSRKLGGLFDPLIQNGQPIELRQVAQSELVGRGWFECGGIQVVRWTRQVRLAGYQRQRGQNGPDRRDNPSHAAHGEV